MNLPPTVREAVERETGPIVDVASVGGGCIANASRVEAERGVYFLKWALDQAGETFEAEAAGLRALAAAGSPLVVPDVVAAANARDGEAGYLMLAWIEPGRPKADFHRQLGEGLARLHESTEPSGRFGFETDNFIGRLPQRNDWHLDWPAFFAEMRLEPQVAFARANGRWRASWDDPYQRLLDSLSGSLPRNPPASICHGDLWNGNVMCTADGTPALIDPAAYYGHAETDLTMMTLFGGFDSEVFDTYHEHHLRQPGHEAREAVYQLYHLINHLNHFGDGYAGAVQRVMKRY